MNLRVLSILTLALGLLASVAAADQVQQQLRLETPEVSPLNQAPPPTCTTGNPEFSTWVFGNWITGNERYAYLVDPGADCGCTEGFLVQRVYMNMQFGTEDTPVTFPAFGGLAEAVWDDALQKYVPGDDLCSGPTWSVTANNPGFYNIFVDLSDGCPCASAAEPFFITFDLPAPFVWWVDALEDNTPEVGISYFDGGSGWQDLITEYGWFGNNIMTADVVCCAQPVANEDRSWSSIKSLYER